tara:strand:+ start:4859 stop:6148 length:1290 start_codon:yes stop_codon:yes gene_type:complete
VRWLILVLAAIPAAAVWATLVFVGAASGWWRTPLAPPGDSAAFAAAVADRLDRDNRGNAAFRLIEGGRVAGEHYVSIGEPVGPDTLFQMASVSKWVTAWGVLRLVEGGTVDLDAPVESYLSRWSLPASEFDAADVTVRRLLSHTAGLTDGLGYGGFPPGTDVQPLEASLDQATDAMAGADGRTRVGLAPGSEWRYSGGGYALLQLMIEDVSGQPFPQYMAEHVLGPLGMAASTFEIAPPDPPQLATFYDRTGEPAPHYRFAAPSAAGLYSSTADLTRFIRAHAAGPAGGTAGAGVLRPDTLTRMFTPTASVLGTDIWGLGVMLYAPNGVGGHIVGHEGSNAPAINTSVRVDPASGDGIVVLVTGHPSLAGEIGSEWVFWRTGRLDTMDYVRDTGRTVLIIGAGWLVIAGAVVIIGWRANRRRATGREDT